MDKVYRYNLEMFGLQGSKIRSWAIHHYNTSSKPQCVLKFSDIFASVSFQLHHVWSQTSMYFDMFEEFLSSWTIITGHYDFRKVTDESLIWMLDDIINNDFEYDVILWLLLYSMSNKLETMFWCKKWVEKLFNKTNFDSKSNRIFKHSKTKWVYLPEVFNVFSLFHFSNYYRIIGGILPNGLTIVWKLKINSQSFVWEFIDFQIYSFTENRKQHLQ